MLAAKSNTGSKNINDPLVQPQDDAHFPKIEETLTKRSG